MNKGIKYTGIPSFQELKNSTGFPSEKGFKRGAIAVIECIQKIPCNPCEDACPYGAITINESINNLPILDEDKCKGCGLCIPKCPGLAIFLVNMNFSENKAAISFPFEYLPLPKIGEEVEAVNREGKVVTMAKVIKVQNRIENDRTPVVTIVVPKKCGNNVRSIMIPQRRKS